MAGYQSSSPMEKQIKMPLIQLTNLSRQWQPPEEPPLYSFWMASSEVDQKFLGHFAKTTTTDNNYLSSFLFRVLGLSVILAEKLLRARKAKALDPVRDPQAKRLIHHILWLAREGLVMVEQYVLRMVDNYVELRVLAYKLKASFYHIFVLFHNDPPVNNRINRTRSDSFSLYPDPLSPRISKPSASASSSQERTTTLKSAPTTGRQRSPAISLGGPVGGGGGGGTNPRTPPGLPIPPGKPYSPTTDNNGNNGTSATYLLPLKDYTPHATAAFKEANDLAERLLPGSHPVRLSVKVEYVAYLYDCLHEADYSRRMARQSIRHVYEAQEGMDDESFEDAAELVGILGRMMRRGLSSSSTTNPPGNPTGNHPPGNPTTAGTSTGTADKGKSTNTNIKDEKKKRRESRRNPNSRPNNNPTTQQPTTWV